MTSLGICWRSASISRRRPCSSTQTSEIGVACRPGGRSGRSGGRSPRDQRQLKVDDMRQRVDVEAPRGHFGGDEDRRPAGLEVVERANSLALALVAVDRGRGDAVSLELLGEVIRAVLRPREDQRLLDAAARMRWLSSSRLRHRSTGWTTWLTSSVAVLRGVTSTLAGLSSNEAASRRTSSENVAENRRLWRFAGTRSSTRRMSRMKPMSSMRSASSRTRTSTCERSMRSTVEEPTRRGDDNRGPGAERAHLGFEADSAVDRRRADPTMGAVGAHAALDLEGELAGGREDEARPRGASPAAVADVGPVTTGWESASRWRIGRTNAAVLPVPVWAPARTSRPDRTSGIAARWTGVGSE